MTTVTLTRLTTQGKAVRGRISFPLRDDCICYPTLENADFLIPEGIYQLTVSWSPRFKKKMPLILDVPGRSGIRIHRGSRPEHSTGCILTEQAPIEIIKQFFDNNEKLRICIRSEQKQGS